MSTIETKGLFHIALIKDVDKTIARFNDLGIGPWQTMTLGDSGSGRLEMNGKPIFLTVKTAITQIGPLMVAVDQPFSRPNPYEGILDQRGGGAHHLAFVVDNIAQATEKMLQFGYKEIGVASEIGPYKDGYGSYFETVENFGTVIELAQLPKEFPPPEGIFPPDGEQTINSSIKIKGLIHLCIAVKDAEKAAKHYEEFFGIGPWRIATMDTAGLKATYKGKEADIAIKGASAMFGQTEVVLEQSMSSPSHLQDFIDKYGQGIHHICLDVKDLNQATEEMHRLGYETTLSISGFGPNGDGEATHFDTERALGIVIELAKKPTGLGDRSL